VFYLFICGVGVSDLEQSEIEIDDDVEETSGRSKKERKRKRGGEKHRKKVSKTTNKVCQCIYSFKSSLFLVIR
jgi:hypothetical protein